MELTVEREEGLRRPSRSRGLLGRGQMMEGLTHRVVQEAMGVTEGLQA